MEKNSEYWEKRLASETWKTYNSLEEKNRELLEFYIDASEGVKDELYQLAEKYSKDGVLSLSDMHKQNRLTELNGKFEKIIEDLGHSTEAFAKKNMQDGFKKVYADIAAGMGDLDFSMPNKKLMEKLMETPWRGDSFSGRLWKNQKKLAVSLNDILLTGLRQGKTAVEIAIMLHNRMGQGFNECHRLVRTETMHYLNDATLQRYKDADVKYVQILAAKDERTCDICGGYHEKIYPIEECVHVPLHANCRCTIIPVTDEKLIAAYERRQGTKLEATDQIARNFMDDQPDNYKNYNKGLSLNGIKERNRVAHDITGKYTTRKSKWSGNIIEDDKKCKKERISGRKEWSCDILLSSKCQDRTIIHEHLHARSGSYLNPISIIKYKNIEEASVEFLAREICKVEGIAFKPNKNHKVEYLYELNRELGICDSDLDFATVLFAKSIKTRYNWLNDQVTKRIERVEISKREYLLKIMEGLKGYR